MHNCHDHAGHGRRAMLRGGPRGGTVGSERHREPARRRYRRTTSLTVGAPSTTSTCVPVIRRA
jgi:hypothetical protein